MATATKQRIELRPQGSPISSLVGDPTATAGVGEVIAVKAGSVTWLDRAKAYYHTAFAVVTGLAVLIVEIGPDLNAIPGLPDTWRHAITAAIVVANMIATRVKHNEVWANAPASAPGR